MTIVSNLRPLGTVSPMTALPERRVSRYFILLVPVSCALSVLFGEFNDH